MPVPAGTGLDRRSFVVGRLRPRALGLRARQAAASSTRASPRPRRGPRSRCSSPSSCPAARTPSRCSTPALDPNYRKLRPTLALPADAGPAFAEDTRLHWHPSLQPLATLHGEGKVSVMPAIGYTHPDQSHFTSRHFWEVGATEARLTTGWMGRYLDRHGSKSNPLQGLSLDYQLQPSLASTEGAGRLAGGTRRLHLLGARRLGRGRGPDARRRSRRSARTAPTRPEPGGEGDKAVRPAAPAARAVREQRRQRLRQPGAVPEGRQRLPAPARRAGGDARRQAAAALRRGHRARRVRHAFRPAAGAGGRPRRHRPHACSRSSATSRRAASPTAC